MLLQIKGKVIKFGRAWEPGKIKMFQISSMEMLLNTYNMYAKKKLKVCTVKPPDLFEC